MTRTTRGERRELSDELVKLQNTEIVKMLLKFLDLTKTVEYEALLHNSETEAVFRQLGKLQLLDELIKLCGGSAIPE